MNRFAVIWAIVLGCLLPLATHAASPSGGDIGIQIVSLSADPPDHMLMAPGGGRDATPAVLFTPPGGANPYGPGIVMLDNGLGSNPGRGDEPTRFAAERLARMGYTVLSLYSHLERGYALNEFGQTRYDIAAAFDLMERMGFEDLVLSGKGYGAVAIANYLSAVDDASLTTPNTRRVKAAVRCCQPHARNPFLFLLRWQDRAGRQQMTANDEGNDST